MSNAIGYTELHTADPAKARDFYGSLFGWQFSDAPGMDYTFIQMPGGAGGGIAKLGPGQIPAWLPYVIVEDVAAATQKAGELGAKVIVAKQAVPGLGWFSVFVDPTGATLAMWQSASK